MSFKRENLKPNKPLSLIVEGINLNEVTDTKFIEYLNNKFGQKFDVNVSDIVIRLIPKLKEIPKDDKKPQQGKKIVIDIINVPFLKLVHTGIEDVKNKKVILSSSNYDLLEDFLK